MALPLGVESLDEVLDIELDESPEPSELRERLGTCLPPGLDLLACERKSGTRAMRVLGARFEVPLAPADSSTALEGAGRFREAGNPLVVRERKGRIREIPLREFVRDLSVEGGVLRFTLMFGEGGGMKPDELLQWLGLDPTAQRVIKLETLADDEGGPAEDSGEGCPSGGPEDTDDAA